MASYHRVLNIFERSVGDKRVECDYDIHPWDVAINGEKWDGKIRLVGFVDVFFLLCYSGESRFEKGIIVYKDDDVIRKLLQEVTTSRYSPKLRVVNQAEVDASLEKEEKGKEPVPKRYFDFQTTSGGLDYHIVSLGHEVGVKTRYRKRDVRRYEIKIRKGRDAAMQKRVYRGVAQHTLFGLLHDAIRLGIIKNAEIIGMLVGKAVGGSIAEDVGSKYLAALMGARGSRDLALEGDRS
ncbi:hypothetical protein N3K66_003376 [Trichothecium roseum]|uniref:Uncharacterized protein n=1 Tax=Trichothecium roseum TaxID=47278 RepID=A0ACC0V6T7_9HYPO|nr:hypothetical protein N3K66_003376 [Trichothecium roseum]